MKGLDDKNEWPFIAVFDIETDEWVKVRCICHMDEYGNKKVFYSRSEYMDWLFTKFPGEYVWAHWGGKFDFQFVIAEAYKRKWSFNVAISGSLTIIVRIRDNKGREIGFCESARLMPDSIANIAKSIDKDGIVYKKLDVDRSKIHTYSTETIVEYCFMDCRILLKGLQELRKTLTGVGCDFAFTLASICTRYVRRSKVLEWHRFYDRVENGKLIYSPDMLRADEFAIAAYYGGRVELFKQGFFENLFLYDITSSYPWSMLMQLPAYFIEDRPPPRNIDKALNCCGITEATIFLPRGVLKFPVLPVRYQGMLIFPEGEFRSRWANNELKAFRERTKHDPRVKITLHAQSVFQPLSFLKPFVDMMYGLRKQAMADGDEFRKYAFKICLNSVYGKLTESIIKRSIIYGDMVSEARDKYGEHSICMTPTPGVYGLDVESTGPFRHVAAGCYITAQSRIRLLEGMEQAARIGAQVYYVDTDSIITDKPVFGLNKNKELGEFSIETEIKEAELFCSKVYKLVKPDGEVIHKAKGMPIRGATKEESEMRWWEFTQKFQDCGDGMFSKAEKQGIYGFLSRVNQGDLEPKAFALKRQLQNPDSKRVHANSNSKPKYVELDLTKVAS